jgi:hypothetical protein
MTRIAELAIELAESLRDGDSLAAAQILSDARDYGDRPAVLAVLSGACQWGVRTSAWVARNRHSRCCTPSHSSPEGKP